MNFKSGATRPGQSWDESWELNTEPRTESHKTLKSHPSQNYVCQEVRKNLLIFFASVWKFEFECWNENILIFLWTHFDLSLGRCQVEYGQYHQGGEGGLLTKSLVPVTPASTVSWGQTISPRHSQTLSQTFQQIITFNFNRERKEGEFIISNLLDTTSALHLKVQRPLQCCKWLYIVRAGIYCVVAAVSEYQAYLHLQSGCVLYRPAAL